MKQLLQKPHIIFSTENSPYPEKVSRPVSHEVAVKALQNAGKGKVISVEGHYGSPEKSILVSDPDEKQMGLARHLIDTTGQESHIESDGYSHKLIYGHGPNSGKIVHGKGTEFHETKPDDFYSVLPTGETFTHNFDLDKSEDLLKSKNVREQRKKVFGTDANAPRLSDKRQKMMNVIKEHAQKKYGMPLEVAQGKRSESGELRTDKDNQPSFDVFSDEGHAREKQLLADQKAQGIKRTDPKPDWRSGKLETQPSPDAAIHELAHLDLAPEGMRTPEFQEHMDELWGQSQSKYGHMQQKKTAGEIQPMALENTIRRQLGLPANKATKPVTANQRALDYEGDRFVEGKDSKGRKAFYDRQTRLQTPETRDRAEQIKQGTVKFNPEKGWQPASDPNALINLRGQGKMDEAQARAKKRFGVGAQPKKLAASEK